MKQGDRLLYDDGRPGHRVCATVLSVSAESMTVQFDDRADTTVIRFDDRAWMDFITQGTLYHFETSGAAVSPLDCARYVDFYEGSLAECVGLWAEDCHRYQLDMSQVTVCIRMATMAECNQHFGV